MADAVLIVPAWFNGPPHSAHGGYFAGRLAACMQPVSEGGARPAAVTAASVGTQIAVSVAFGFGILAAVYTVATVSGAHINPAVTFGLAAAREFPWRLVPAYWAAQLAGGIGAALANWAMYGDKLGSALDRAPPGRARACR